MDASGAGRRATGGGRRPGALVHLGWAIEEFRMQAFAQELGVRGAVSGKRLRRLLAFRRERLLEPVREQWQRR